MTVNELIARLEKFPGDSKVHLAYGYGDYWSTTVAPEIENVSEGQVTHSDYHQMDKLVESEDDEMDSDSRIVVVLE